MNPIQINPYVFGALVSILTMLMGLVLGTYLSSTRSTLRKLSETVGRLDNSVTRLDTTIAGMKEMNVNFVAGCNERHGKLDKGIDKIWDKIDGF